MKGAGNRDSLGLKLVLFFMLLFGGLWWLMAMAVSGWHR
jgi:hypothetical protein